ncbi:MAG: hypothetical protein AAF725_16105 [Acidobacteriota bacterium]
MSPEGVVIFTVWAALVCYPAGPLGRAVEGPRAQRWTLRVWTAGCLLFWVHVVSAFDVFYGWSHAYALAETARQTRELTGFDSSSGLYLNYLFALAWTIDAWRARRVGERRLGPGDSLGGFLALHGFFLFMIVNGAVVFVPGPRRWLGLVITLAGAAAVGWAVRRARPGRAAAAAAT